MDGLIRQATFLAVTVALLCVVAGAFIGCVPPSGDVVRVRTVEGSRDAVLEEEHRARLDEIKKDTAEVHMDEKLNRVLEHTPRFSVAEYLERFPEASEAGKDYEVGGYDVLCIIVYEEKDLSREAVRVSGDGFISFPLIGRVKVEGRNTSEIEGVISRKLAEGQFLLDAHVSVMVRDFESKNYLVLGAVEAPGSYSLRAEERLLDALSRAGGLAGEQRSKRAMIIRTVYPQSSRESKVVIDVSLDGLMKRGDQYANLYLSNHDTVYVAPPEYFYIIGEVNEPGSYALPEDEITLVEAIGMAGGFTKIASRNKTRIIRVENGQEKIIEVQVDAITEAGKMIQDVVIQAGDVIVVPESFF